MCYHNQGTNFIKTKWKIDLGKNNCNFEINFPKNGYFSFHCREILRFENYVNLHALTEFFIYQQLDLLRHSWKTKRLVKSITRSKNAQMS